MAPGDRVATTLPAGLAFAELLHALPKLGAVLVPLNTRLTANERRWQREDSSARLVMDEPLEGEEAEVELRSVFDAARPHTVIYTSGTTARPRGVVLTYANHHASALASAWNVGVAPDDRWLCPLPLFHVGGLAVLLRSSIYGTAAILHDGFRADVALESLASGAATLASLVPTMLHRLREAGLEEAPALRAALLGGGPVPRDLLEWARERELPVLVTYGMTETASQVATAPAGGGRGAQPLPGVEIQIDSRAAVVTKCRRATANDHSGQEGEILLRGPMVAAAALASDGWLHTGDRGRLDDNGLLHVEGRLKDVIVSGGENVSAGEVEEVLLSHPSVADAAVAARADARWGEAVVAYVVLSSAAEPAELIEYCRARLAGFKVPKSVAVVDDLPRNAAGKLMRGALRSGSGGSAGARVHRR